MIGEPHPFDPLIPEPGGATPGTISPSLFDGAIREINALRERPVPIFELLEPYKTLLEKAATVLIAALDGEDVGENRVIVAEFVLNLVANQPPPVITYKD